MLDSAATHHAHMAAAPRSFFPTLRNAALISLGFLVGATALDQQPWLATLGGVIPLVWYHLVYLASRARAGLSQSAIDSVYYFGFLVTIAALGVSAVSLAVHGNKVSMDTIAYQFGLGLLATGYAVFARMHLTSISTWVDEQSPEAVLDRYLRRTQELVTNVEMASEQFVTLASNLMARTEAVTKTATDTTEKSMLELARIFDQQLRQTLASGNQGLAELRSLVNETSFAEEREALARSVKVTLECVLHLNKALQEFSERSSESARSSEGVRTSSDTLAKSISELSQRIEQVGGENGTITRTVKTFDEVQSHAVGATQALSGVVEELGQVGGSLGGVGTTFKDLKLLTAKAQQQLDALVQTSGQLDGAAENFGRSAQKTQALAESIDRVVGALPNMGGRIQALDGQFEQLRITTSAVEQQLQSLPQPADAAVALTSQLREALQGLNKVLQAASVDARALSSNTADTVQHLEHSRKLAADITTLQATTQAVNDLLATIVENASRTTASLTSSSQTLERAMSTSAGALERDVQTATRAASLFTERLAHVAQGIIEETRRVRAA